MTTQSAPGTSREYPLRPIVGVGAVVLREDRVLLIKRGKPPRQGQWSLPGGGQEVGETVEEAVRREVREEAGLELDWVEFLAVVDAITREEDGRVRWHYTLVDFVGEASGEPAAGGDADAAAWLTPAEIAGLGLWTETLRIIELAFAKRATRS